MNYGHSKGVLSLSLRLQWIDPFIHWMFGSFEDWACTVQPDSTGRTSPNSHSALPSCLLGLGRSLGVSAFPIGSAPMRPTNRGVKALSQLTLATIATRRLFFARARCKSPGPFERNLIK